ncbi:MAG: HAMP domain-containing sensor histidine kinase [Gemmatimonadota bacterium]
MQQTKRPTAEPIPVTSASLDEREVLARRVQELEHENRTKTDFLALVSHELRTPLNSIMGYTELLLAGIPEPLSATTRYHVDRIRASTLHQLQLVNEIMRYAKLESTGQRAGRERCSLHLLVDDVVSMIHPAIEQKGLELYVHRRESVTVYTDATRVRQILINLMWNAIKFTRAGRIGVAVASDEDGFTIEVSDTGIGIPGDVIDRVFDPFWRAERVAGLEDGVGLGLTVRWGLARSLGGDLTVTSKLGSGSTFVLRIPSRVDQVEEQVFE